MGYVQNVHQTQLTLPTNVDFNSESQNTIEEYELQSKKQFIPLIAYRSMI